MRIAESYVGIRADTSGFRGEANRGVTAALAGIRAAVGIGVDTRGLQAEVGRAAAMAGAGQESEVNVTADASGLTSEVRQAARVAEAGSGGIDIPVRADTRAASGGFGQLRQGLADTSRMVTVLRGAFASLAWGTIVAGISLAVGALGALGAAAVGLTSALAPVAGLLGALPGAAIGAATGLGALLLATTGIGDALKALSDQESESVESARDLGREHEATAERINDAEASVVATIREHRAAEEDVKRAIDERRESLEDLALSLRGAAIDEEEAVLRVQETLQRLQEVQADSTASEAERRRADINHRRAIQNLLELRERQGDLREEAERAAVGQDAGAQRVAAAQERQTRAQEAMVGAVRNLAIAHRDAGRVGEDAQDKVTQKMRDLPAAAQGFVAQLFSMRGLFAQLRNTAAANLFPGLTVALERSTALFPIVNRAVGDMARVFGETAAQGARMVTTGPFRADLASIMNTNTGLMRNLGTASLSVFSGLRHIAVAAEPLVTWIGQLAVRFGNMFDRWAEGARASGALGNFFQRTISVAEQLFRILGDVAVGLGGVGRAAAPLGQWLLDRLEVLTQRFRDFSTSVAGQDSMRRFFDSMRPALTEIARLVGAIGRGFVNLAQQPQLAGLISQLRTDLLPPLLRLADVAATGFTPAFIGLLSEMVTLFANLAGQGGALTGFINALTGILRVVNALVDSHPVVRGVFATVLGAAGALAAIRFVGAITGVTRLARAFGLIGTSASAQPGLVARAMTAVGARAASALRAGVVGLGGIVATAMRGAAAAAVTGGAAIARGVAVGVGAVGGLVSRAFLGLAPVVATALRTVGLVIVANAPWVLLAVGLAAVVVVVARNWDSIVRIVGDAVGAIGRFVGRIPSIIRGAFDVVGSFVSVGMGIVRGLWNGIVSQAEWFRDRFLGFLRAILPGPVERFLGISSPSRMFMGYGRNIMEAMALGITGAAGAPAAALNSAVRRLQPAAVPVPAGRPFYRPPHVDPTPRGGGAGARGGDTYHITVHNPEPEPAGTSLIREIGKARWMRGR